MWTDDENVNVPSLDDPLWATLVRFSRTPLASEDAAEMERWLAEDPMRRDMVRAVQRLASMARDGQRSRRSLEAWARVSERLPEVDVLPPTPRSAPQLVFGAQRSSNRTRRYVLAAALAAGVVAIVVQRDQIAQIIDGWFAAPPVPMRELATRVGERATIKLEDGSTVIVGPMSKLRYGKLVGVSERSLQLEGEAFFDVAPDPAHPFRVLADYATVQVVGTAFDVRAYPRDTVVQVTTARGKVALRSRISRDDGGGALVERGQRGTVDTSGYVRVVSGADVERDIGWTRGQLSYQLVPLDALLQDLGRWYDVDFALATPSLANVRVTITFDSATADDAVTQLAALLDVPHSRRGRVVTLGAH
jgi:ferric-dicitrate binding protein FerR (iron transport regulator)